MTIQTWTDENSVVYWYDEEWRAGRDVFEIQDAVNACLADVSYDLEISALDLLERTQYLYVSLATLAKEVWLSNEVFDAPRAGLVPVGTIQLEDIE